MYGVMMDMYRHMSYEEVYVCISNILTSRISLLSTLLWGTQVEGVSDSQFGQG